MLRCDLYPAEVLLPSQEVLRGVRVMVTARDLVLVWGDVTGVPKVLWYGQSTQHLELPERGAVWHQKRLRTETAAGAVIANQLRTGCNCGQHALRYLDERDAIEFERTLPVG